MSAFADLAAALKMDELEFFLKNAEQTDRPAVYQEELKIAADLIGYKQKAHLRGDPTPGPLKRGLGMAIGMHGAAYERTGRLPASVDQVSRFGFIRAAPQRAPVAELVDAPDSKSGFLTEVLVRVRPGAPSLKRKRAGVWSSKVDEYVNEQHDRAE